MQCPVCKEVTLVMAERQSVEVDYCPQCRGIWLDRGELDKIIERTVQAPRVSQIVMRAKITVTTTTGITTEAGADAAGFLGSCSTSVDAPLTTAFP